MEAYKKALRILWAGAGIMCVAFDVMYFGNTSFEPSFWTVFGMFIFFTASTGLAGGIGAALVTQGALKYLQMTSFEGGKLVFSADFSIFEMVANAAFAAYGAFLLFLQIRKLVRRVRERNTAEKK